MQVKLSPPAKKGSSPPHQPIVVRRVQHAVEWRAADELVNEYLDWLDDSLGAVMVHKAGIALADRLGVALSFAPPNHFYLAWFGGQPIGCAGVRVVGPDAELTRLFVSKRARGLEVSERLVRAAIVGVRGAGHSYLRVETHRPTMPVAYDLYRRLGFEERRGGLEVDGAIAMVLPLDTAARVP
jgi:GNAT superfamily N-acetyltransferase